MNGSCHLNISTEIHQRWSNMRWSGSTWRERVLLFNIRLYRQLLHINLCIWLFFEHFEHFESNIDRASGSARLELEIFDRAITSARLGPSNKDSVFDSNSRTRNSRSTRSESSRVESNFEHARSKSHLCSWPFGIHRFSSTGSCLHNIKQFSIRQYSKAF